jgi:hypothetical protein
MGSKVFVVCSDREIDDRYQAMHGSGVNGSRSRFDGIVGVVSAWGLLLSVFIVAVVCFPFAALVHSVCWLADLVRKLH